MLSLNQRSHAGPPVHTRTLWAGLIACLLVLIGPHAATGQTIDDALRYGQRLPATGARLTGLAGAGTAGVDDYSALFYNPAGLGWMDASQVAGSFSLLTAREEVLYEALPLEGGPSTPTAAFDETSAAPALGNLAAVYKVPTARGSFVLGAALNRTHTFERSFNYAGQNASSSITDTYLPFDDEFEVDGDDIIFDRSLAATAFNAGAIEFFDGDFEDGFYPFLQAIAPGTTIEQRDDVVEEGRMTEASFGGAVAAAPNVMIGLSANVVFGEYRFSRLYQEIDVFDENTPELYSVELGNGQLLEGFDQLIAESRLDADVVGFSLRGGFSADVTPNLRTGFTLETPTYYYIDEQFGTRIETFFDEGGSLADGSLAENVFEYELRTPWRIGAGLHYTVQDLTLSGDVEFIDWTQMEFDGSDLSSADRAFLADLNRQLEDLNAVFNVRAGLEYRLDQLAVRGGVAFQPDPRDEEIELQDNETTNRDQLYFSAGFSYQFDPQFTFHFGWLQQRFDDQYRPYTSLSTIPGEPEGSFAAPFVDEDVIRNQFLFGVSYRF